MAALAGDLSKQILSHSDAAKAFRPWWDTLEDSFMYSFVIMGLITLPMTFLTGTPIDCTIHPDLWSSNSTLVIDGDILTHEEIKHFRYLRIYAKKYCTEMKISPFVLYFPFCLFLVPLVLVSIEKIFIGIYNAQTRLETLYSSLVKTSLEREDVAKMEKENEKNSHEIRQTLRNSSGCHYSYLYRTICELVAAVCLVVFFSNYTQIEGISKPMFDCNVHGVGHKCIVPNTRFFAVTFYLSIISLISYGLLSLYNLLWLLHPKVSKLQSILSGCQRRTAKTEDVFDLAKKNFLGPEIQLDMYYDRKARDFKLLMNLLAEQSGLAQSFRILAVFDKHFQRLWRATDVKVIIQRPESDVKSDGTDEQSCKEESAILWVLWNDAKIADYINSRIKKSLFEYTVEICPPTEASIQSFLYHQVPDFSKFSSSSYPPISRKNSHIKLVDHQSQGKLGSEEDNIGHQLSSIYKYCAKFDGICMDKDSCYNVTISTELDGKTITQLAIGSDKASKCNFADQGSKEAKNNIKH